MIMWLFIVFAVAGFLIAYLGLRLINPSPLAGRWKLLAWLMVTLMLSVRQLDGALGLDGQNSSLIGLIDWAGYTFLGLVSILVVFMLLRDLPVLALRTSTALQKLFVRRSKRPYFIEPDRERRRFLLNATNTAALAVTLPMSGYAVFEARRTPSVVRNELPILGLPAGLDGFTIAQITDTHVGPTIRGDWMRRVVDEVNGLAPDMIVHTGDIVDGSVESLFNDASPMGDFSAPHGVWFCTGNHEYYSGVDQWVDALQTLNMRPLLNENTLVDTGQGRILMAGVTDFRGDRIHPGHVHSPERAMADAPDHDVSILLAHQPISIYEASDAGFDIQLSGHTHGGQYFPYTLAIHLFQPYVRGLHLHNDTLLYVNVGTGYWGPPMRLGAEPEITLHTLRRA